jgi:hypothetical protein
MASGGDSQSVGVLEGQAGILMDVDRHWTVGIVRESNRQPQLQS